MRNNRDNAKDFDRLLKVAVLGCGKMGLNHIKVIQYQKNAKIIGVADPRVNNDELRGLLPNVTEVFADARDLFQKLKPDVTHITTPPSFHATLAKLALNCGSHVYVEKPFVSETTQAESIISLAESNGLKVCAGHQLLFERPTKKIKQFLSQIGEIVHIESYFSFRKVRRSISAVEQLIDILPHPVYLLLNFLKPNSSTSKSEVVLQSVNVNSTGEVRGVLSNGAASGILIVTLRGRPIESYLRIVGTNGCIYADFVLGTVTKLAGPGTSAVSIILNPYSHAKQTVSETTRSIIRLITSSHKSYPGLAETTNAFYSSIQRDDVSPVSPESIIETVRICETIGKKLKEHEVKSNEKARSLLLDAEAELKMLSTNKKSGITLVTGGTGFLGSKLVAELSNHGWPVRVLARQTPSFRDRAPGVEYLAVDLSDRIPDQVLKGVDSIVHCAAETAGGMAEHQRNSVLATKNLIQSAARAGITKFIHISSLATLKPSHEIGGPIDEDSPLDLENVSRGPYVWGKAQSEHLASELGTQLGLLMKIIRLGPLVDYNTFEPPGRLGRELGTVFFAVGNRRSKLDLCDVSMAAQVIRYYLNHFDAAPQVLNLVEATAPTRGELINRLLKQRLDLKVFWLPLIIIKIISPPLRILQRLVFPGRKPIDIYAAFTSENYNSNLAAETIKKTEKD